MGFAEAFDYASPAEIFAEYAALTGLENDGRRDLDVSAYAGITSSAYATLKPFQWPSRAGAQPADSRFFATGGYFTPDRKARLISTPFRAPSSTTGAAYPLALNTGRIRDQWHTMTRTGKTARLMSHFTEPFVEMSPEDARAAGISNDDLAVVESRHGRIVVRASIVPSQKAGSVFVPMHWTEQYASAARVDVLVSALVDPDSGQPELKFTPVRVTRYEARWHAFALSTARPPNDITDYWAIAPVMKGGWRVELADVVAKDDWEAFAAHVLPAGDGARTERLAYHDVRTGQYRFALFCDGRCAGLLFIAPRPVRVSRTWAVEQLGQECSSEARLRLLAGRPGVHAPERGRIVCACFDVGENEIHHAIVARGCTTVAAVGACVKAGTNCGSCRSEIGRLINDAQFEEAG